MAYNTGICNSFDELKTALISCCVSNGWTSTTDSAGKDVIYKDNLYVMVETLSYCLRIAGRTGVSEGSTPTYVGITDFYNDGDPWPGNVEFPVTYFCFTYASVDEVYFVIKYNNKYQWLAFGKSNIALPGTGLWIAGTAGLYGTTKSKYNIPSYISTSTGSSQSTAPALFWMAYNYYSATYNYYGFKNYWLHSNINPNYPWSLAQDNYESYAPVGKNYLNSYLSGQPNRFNQQSLLLPILVNHAHSVYSGYYSLVAQLQNARHIVMSYIDPETVLYHGVEQWVVFPHFARTGTPNTGTYAHAFKKEA